MPVSSAPVRCMQLLGKLTNITTTLICYFLWMGCAEQATLASGDSSEVEIAGMADFGSDIDFASMEKLNGSDGEPDVADEQADNEVEIEEEAGVGMTFLHELPLEGRRCRDPIYLSDEQEWLQLALRHLRACGFAMVRGLLKSEKADQVRTAFIEFESRTDSDSFRHAPLRGSRLQYTLPYQDPYKDVIETIDDALRNLLVDYLGQAYSLDLPTVVVAAEKSSVQGMHRDTGSPGSVAVQVALHPLNSSFAPLVLCAGRHSVTETEWKHIRKSVMASQRNETPAKLFKRAVCTDKFIAAPMEAGDAVIYESQIWHWGGANSEALARYALYINYKNSSDHRGVFANFTNASHQATDAIKSFQAALQQKIGVNEGTCDASSCAAPQAMKPYTVGWYAVQTDIKITSSEGLGGKEICMVKAGERVYVEKILPHPEFERIRAKIHDPAGFASVVGLGNDSDMVWLQRDEEFEKALPKISASFVADDGSGTFAMGSEGDKAWDNDPVTFYDAGAASGGYTAANLLARYRIRQVTYVARSGQEIRMVGGRFEGANDLKGPWTILSIIASQPLDNPSSNVVPVASNRSFQYVRYHSPDNGYCNVADIQIFGEKTSVVLSPKVTRSVQALPRINATFVGDDDSGVYEEGSEGDKAWDNDPMTSYDTRKASAGYTAADLLARYRIRQVAYIVRLHHEERMINGTFEGSNNKNGPWTILSTITARPSANPSLNIVPIAINLSFQYVRYRSPDDGYCNVADIQIFGDQVLRSDQYIEVAGFCSTRSVCNGVFDMQGITASGTPFYRKHGGGSYIYYDPDCNFGGTAGRWICDDSSPSTTLSFDLDDDQDCDYYGRIDHNEGFPWGTKTWQVHCGGVWTNKSITLQQTSAPTTPIVMQVSASGDVKKVDSASDTVDEKSAAEDEFEELTKISIGGKGKGKTKTREKVKVKKKSTKPKKDQSADSKDAEDVHVQIDRRMKEHPEQIPLFEKYGPGHHGSGRKSKVDTDNSEFEKALRILPEFKEDYEKFLRRHKKPSEISSSPALQNLFWHTWTKKKEREMELQQEKAGLLRDDSRRPVQMS